MKYYVYSHITKDTNQIFYVGKGTGRRARGKRRNPYWKNVANKHGWKVLILKHNLDEKDALEVEKYYIKHIGRRNIGTGTLVNMTDGGEGTSGLAPANKGNVGVFKHSEETKRKISENHRNLGKKLSPFSEEHRKKMSLAAKGKVVSNETRKKMSESQKGKVRSAETLKKMSLVRKGRVFSEETRKKMSDAAKRRCANKTNIIE